MESTRRNDARALIGIATRVGCTFRLDPFASRARAFRNSAPHSRELSRMGAIPLGAAVVTGAGRLPYRGIIHVAGINMFWRASHASISDSVRNAVLLAQDMKFATLAMPVIGAGSGGYAEAKALAVIEDTLRELECGPEVTVVRFRPAEPPW